MIISANYVETVKGSFRQTRKQFENMCKIFIPNAVFKDAGTCGYICFRGNTEVTSAEVALLSENKWAVYDKWRDCTITDDFDYVFNFLKRHEQNYTESKYAKS